MTPSASLDGTQPGIDRSRGIARLAIIVSHPIQYYVPVYRRLAEREDLEVKVFYTWHGAENPQLDQGFGKEIAWDIPLTGGYAFEVVPNTSRDPGTHHFRGLRNPELGQRVLAWKPDAVHLTGYAYASHLAAMREFHRRGVPLLFRGDSHLLDQTRNWRWWIKRAVLRRIYRWPAGFLYVGQANRAYYEAYGVPASRLFLCPHAIDVPRFSEPNLELESQALAWRQELGIGADRVVLLFAGKFEEKKRPAALMRAIREQPDPRLLLLMVGDGVLGPEVRKLAAEDPERFRVLPFQNQSRMPLVYRLGDIFVLPSAYGETWGLAVNEAMACGRPALVSDRVGCAADLIDPCANGDVFRADDWRDFAVKLGGLTAGDWANCRGGIRMRAGGFSTEGCADTVASVVQRMIVRTK